MSFALFSNESNLLPGACQPYPDELLSSWLTRIAFHHGLSTLEFCMLTLSQGYNQSYDIDRMITPDKINRLVERTNCTTSQIEATTLLTYCDRLFVTNNLANGSEKWLLPSKMIRYPNDAKLYHRSGLMFCPLCLKKQVYFKKQWRLALSFVCTDCRCYLVDSCPHCKRGNSFMDTADHDFLKYKLNDYLLRCHHCKEDVTECDIEMATERVLCLQRKFNHLIDHEISKSFVTKKSYLRVLFLLCRFLLNPSTKECPRLRLFVQNVFRLNGLPYTDYPKMPTNDVRRIDVRKRADIVLMAHSLLCKWPQRFLRLCHNSFVGRNDILRFFYKAPEWFVEPIYDELLPLKASNRVNRAKKIYREYTAMPMIKRIKTVDYDFAMGEEYDENELYYEGGPPQSRGNFG